MTYVFECLFHTSTTFIFRHSKQDKKETFVNQYCDRNRNLLKTLITNCYVIFCILFLLHFLIFLNIHCIILVFICTTMDIKQTKKYSATFFWYHYYISYPFNTWIAYKQLLLLCPQHKKTWLIITVISFANRICVPTLVTIQILTNVQFNYNFYVLPVFL